MVWRSRFRAQSLLIASLFLLMFLVAWLIGAPPPDTAYDPDSRGANGLRVLQQWLAEMGYRVQRMDGAKFALPDGVDLLFIHPGRRAFTGSEASQLRTWVAAGGALVLVHGLETDRELAAVFGVESTSPGLYSAGALQAQPLLPAAAASWSLFSAAPALDLSAAPAAVPVLQNNAEGVTAAVQTLDSGVVWHLSEAHALVNQQLAVAEQAHLVPAFMRTVPDGGLVVFDTFHLTAPDATISTLQDWLYRTPVGWATLFGAIAVGSHLLLQGRRLGPPLPVADEQRRREAADFVKALALLLRKTRQRAAVARHHRQRLKAGLARSSHIRPDLPDDEFLRQFQQTDHHLTPEALESLGRILTGLAADSGERQLVERVGQIDSLLNK